MSNFSQKLEESTEEELNNSINELDPRFGILASNELTKRSLNNLQKTIEIFNKETSKQTEKMLFLTYTTTFLTIVLVCGLIIQIKIAL